MLADFVEGELTATQYQLRVDSEDTELCEARLWLMELAASSGRAPLVTYWETQWYGHKQWRDRLCFVGLV